MTGRTLEPADTEALFDGIGCLLAQERIAGAADELTDALYRAAGEVGKRLDHAQGLDHALLTTGEGLRRLIAVMDRAHQRARTELRVALELLHEGVTA